MLSIFTAALTSLLVTVPFLSTLQPQLSDNPGQLSEEIGRLDQSIIELPTPEIGQIPAEMDHHEELELKTTTSSIRSLITSYAKKYAVQESLLLFTVICEAGVEMDPTIQSGHTYPRDIPTWGVKKGDQELSFGLAQIHLPSNPGVTKAQAVDPDYALNFLAGEISRGGAWRWSCLR
jgi:hypothetical protein